MRSFSQLLMLIPTLILVSIIIFFMKQNVPQDPVEQYADIYSNDGRVSVLSSKEYNSIAYQLKLNQPNFYFSIRPNHFPDSIHTILPLQRRATTKALLKKYKNWHLVDHLMQWRYFYAEDEIKAISLVNALAKEINVELTDEFNSAPDSIKILVNDLSSNKIRWPIPSFKWHGLSNQYHHWVATCLSNKPAKSSVSNDDVFSLVLHALRWTLLLSMMSILLAYPLGVALGLMFHLSDSNIWRYMQKLFDALYTIPMFCLGTLLVMFFTTDDYGKWTNLFPAIHSMDYTGTGFVDNISNNAKFLILPVICMVTHYIGIISYYMSSNLSKELTKPYIRTALSKGVSRSDIIKKHAFKNSIFPIITLLTGAIPASLAGALIIEVIFNIPGMGKLIYSSVRLADWNVLFPAILMISFATLIFYWLADIIYQTLDSRAKI